MQWITLSIVLSLALPWTVYAQFDTEGDINTDVVVFVSPDSTGIERLKTEHGEEDFYVIADDEMYYRSIAYDLLDSLGVAYTFVERRPLRFVVDGEASEYTWSDVEANWFVVVYEADKEPRITYSVDLPNVLNAAENN